MAVFSGSAPDSAGGLLQNEPDTSHGPIPGLRAPIVGIAVDWVTGGYWLVAADGGVFAYNAPFEGSTGGVVLNQPVVGMAFDAATGGYWLVAADGGVFSFNAPFQGSTGGMRLNQPIVGMAPDAATDGYRLVAADGGVFSFHAPFDGSTGGLRLAAPVVAVTTAPGSPSSPGYPMCTTSDLSGTYLGSDGAGGNRDAELQLSLTGLGGCALFGAPSVTLQGADVNATVTPDNAPAVVKPALPTVIELDGSHPRAYVDLEFDAVPPTNDPSCPAVSDVEVTPPGATTALTIPADDPSFAPCGDVNPADATPVTVTQFQPSPLLPG